MIWYGLTLGWLALIAIGVIWTPFQIGKERKPKTAGDAAFELVVAIGLAIVLTHHLGWVA